MPENDFEKQVEQLFAEFRLKPSAEVWSKVDRRIRREKQRRRVFVWIPLSLLLLGIGGYRLLIYNAGDSDRSDFTTTVVADDNALDANLDKHGLGSDSHASNGSSRSVKLPVHMQASDNVRQQAKPVDQLPAPDRTGKPAPGWEEKPVFAYPTNGNHKKRIFTNRKVVGLRANSEARATVPLITVQQSIAGSASFFPDIESVKIPAPIYKVDVFEKAPIGLVKRDMWEWGVSGGIGSAFVSEGFSGLFGGDKVRNPGISAMSSTPNISSRPGTLSGQNIIAASPPPASPVKRGLSWQVGGFVKRKMNRRLVITGGLQYHYYSTHRMVGNDISNNGITLSNTAGNVNASYTGYYAGESSMDYTNGYHFMEMPAGIEWQLNKSPKLPLQLNGGLTLSWLANATAVHYHQQTGSYYKDGALFYRMQTGMYAGAVVTFLSNSHRPLHIGPVVQYGLTNLVKPSENPDQHFIYAALKVEWILGRK